MHTKTEKNYTDETVKFGRGWYSIQRNFYQHFAARGSWFGEWCHSTWSTKVIVAPLLSNSGSMC